MVRVEVSESAAHELRERVPSHGRRGLVIQPGPRHEQYQGPEWTMDDEALAPGQRWNLVAVGNESFADLPDLPPQFVALLDVDDFNIMVLFPPTSGVLKVQVIDGAIRIYESAA